MKKIVFFALTLTLCYLSSSAQYFRTRENAATVTTDYYKQTPGVGMAFSYVYWRFADSARNWVNNFDTMHLPKFALKNEGIPHKFIWVDSTSGKVKSSSFGTVFQDYYTKSQADGRYLQSFTEVDPVWTADKPSYLTSATAASTYYLSSNPTGYITSSSLTWANITGKPSFATVATSGAYADLSGTPNLSVYYLASNPSGYINGINSGMVTTALGFTPYSATNPAGYISNITSSNVTTALGYTPINPNGTTTQYFRGNGSLAPFPTNVSTFSNDAGYLTSINSGQVTSALGFTPYNATNPAGYITGINSGNVTTALGFTPITNTRTLTINGTAQDLSVDRAWTLTTANVSEVTNLYYTNARARGAISLTTTGTGAATYNSTTGVLNVPTPSTAKRIETYTGTTDGSGNYTVTYGTAFSTVPDVQPQLQAGTTSQVVRITSSTTTGFTVNVTNRASVTLLSIEVLLAATTPVSGASVGVLVTSR